MALKINLPHGRTGEHGGSIERAATLFPEAPTPFVDLSTGINPHSYPHFAIAANEISRLPEPARLRELEKAAAETYGAGPDGVVVAAPGTQPLMTFAAGLVKPGLARILGPTYSEHERCAFLAGHQVETVGQPEDLEDADLAIIVNPNNPDGRLVKRARMMAIARGLRERGGLLVVDEAFMDVSPPDYSLANDVAGEHIVVLRSFGKFYGLAGLRLAFAIAGGDVAAALASALGPWPVSAPALACGIKALRDGEWRATMLRQLDSEAERLHEMLVASGLEPEGGTSLFRLVSDGAAADRFGHLGRNGILVRRFENRPQLLRFGLPANEAEWGRLETALKSWESGGA